MSVDGGESDVKEREEENEEEKQVLKSVQKEEARLENGLCCLSLPWNICVDHGVVIIIITTTTLLTRIRRCKQKGGSLNPSVGWSSLPLCEQPILGHEDATLSVPWH